MKLTIYHDGQFWVGVVEVERDGKLKAWRRVFGSEPKMLGFWTFYLSIWIKWSMDCLVELMSSYPKANT